MKDLNNDFDRDGMPSLITSMYVRAQMGELVGPRETVARQTTFKTPNTKFVQTMIVETSSTATQTDQSADNLAYTSDRGRKEDLNSNKFGKEESKVVDVSLPGSNVS